MAGLERLLWYLNLIATFALLVRLIQCKLWRTYPFLFLYWLAQGAGTLAMLPIPLRSLLYAQVYYAAQTVSLFLAIFVVLELYREALARHPALAGFGRRSVLLLMGIAALMAASGLTLDSTIPRGQFLSVQLLSVHRFLTVERTLGFMLLAFLLLISGFLLWFPVKVKRNVVIYMVGFVLFYSSRSIGLLLANLLPQTVYLQTSNVLLGLSLSCLLLWLVGLRQEGEEVTAVTGHRWDAAAMGRLSVQLDEINTALARFVRSERRL